MKFWDSSAIVPLLVKQAKSESLLELLKSDQMQIVSWTTNCECFSALARLEREGALDTRSFASAHRRLVALAASWQVVTTGQAFEDETKRILRTHNLRCADAFQLAAAVLASSKTPSSLVFVTLDEKLAQSASREGFEVVEYQ